MPQKPRRAKPVKGAPRERKTTTERGYDNRHVKLRELLLQTFPICQNCEAAWATQAHHRRYPAETLEDYAALCEACHTKHHREENQSR